MTKLVTNVAALTFEEASEMGLTSNVIENGSTFFYRRSKHNSDLYAIQQFNMYKEYSSACDNPSRDDVWLDCGATIGSFAIPLSKHVECVVCIEASWPNYTMLLENIQLNGCRNIIPIYGAVYHTGVKYVEFHQSTTYNCVIGSLVEDPKFKHVSYQVPAFHFDTLVRLFHIDNVKMDIEGEEYPIIISTSVLHSINNIVIEHHSDLVGDIGDVKLGVVYQILLNNGLNVDMERSGKYPMIYGRRG